MRVHVVPAFKWLTTYEWDVVLTSMTRLCTNLSRITSSVCVLVTTILELKLTVSLCLSLQ